MIKPDTDDSVRTAEELAKNSEIAGFSFNGLLSIIALFLSASAYLTYKNL